MIQGIPRIMLAAIYYSDGFSYGNLSNLDSSEDLVLLQFTGLKDKNGKEIYEGDIVKDKRDWCFEIYWNNDEACYWARLLTHHAQDEHQSFRVGTHFTPKISHEIIGSIYENPEFLK